LIAMDFDQAVVGIASQPFWLFWVADGKVRSHAPDYFARRVDGSAVVVDCRPVERRPPRDVAALRLRGGHAGCWVGSTAWSAPRTRL
jgi:hypothetical protein